MAVREEKYQFEERVGRPMDQFLDQGEEEGKFYGQIK
jgi:hypothetical protein